MLKTRDKRQEQDTPVYAQAIEDTERTQFKIVILALRAFLKNGLETYF